MAFTLRLTHGSDAPELLSFDSAEVRMGRTADNDVVIKDPSSSRSHARVYEEDGQFFVEDLKSANGTTLNEKELKAPAKLKAGDRIAIGEVVMEFATAAAPSSTLDGEDDEDPNATMLKPPVAKPVSKPAVSAVARPSAPRRSTGAELEATAPKAQALRPSKALPSIPAPAAAEEAPVQTAADRARERRELQRSSLGRAQVLWNELPRPTRIALAVAGSAMTLFVLVNLVVAMRPRRVVHKMEQVELTPNGDPLPESFGEGDGVDFSRPDMKSFTFTYAAPTSIVGVLHYQATDCSKDEVAIELNGVQAGTVPADTMETEARQLEMVLPSSQLKLNEPNEVVFDNVTNPPASNTWRVWNVWVEVIPVPRMSNSEASNRARDNFERAAKLYDLREVGSMNLFRSWKEYRDAWLMLEATPDSPPELLATARARMREIRPMLDKKCSLVLMAFQREVNQSQPDRGAARKILQEVPAYFEKEHPCFGISRGLMASLEDLGELQ